MDQAVIETLTLALDSGLVGLPETGTILFANAQDCSLFRELPKHPLVCQQDFKPFRDSLEQDNRTLLPLDAEVWPEASLIIYLPPRQKEAMKAGFARAMAALSDDATLVCCLPNLGGAKSAEKLLKKLTGNIDNLSKNKCRAFWAQKTNALDTTLAQEWIDADEVFEIPGTGIYSRPGVFSWNRIDAGSELLVQHLPEKLSGRGADLGAGQGYLSLTALNRYDSIEHLHLIEADWRAVGCAAKTLEPFKDRTTILHADATKNMSVNKLDFVLTNPPFHTSRADDAALGQSFIRSAAGALAPYGELFMVANRHLPYEATLTGYFKTVDRLTDEGGYKVIRAAAPKRRR